MGIADEEAKAEGTVIVVDMVRMIRRRGSGVEHQLTTHRPSLYAGRGRLCVPRRKAGSEAAEKYTPTWRGRVAALPHGSSTNTYHIDHDDHRHPLFLPVAWSYPQSTAWQSLRTRGVASRTLSLFSGPPFVFFPASPISSYPATFILADAMADKSDPPPAIANAMRQAHQVQMRLQTAIDRTTPFAARRWGATGGLLALFMLRIVLSQGWYIGE